MTPYCDVNQVTAYLGLPLDGGQAAYITDVLAPAITTRLDQYLRRSWQPGPIVGERVWVYGDRAWLQHTPVTALTALTARGSWPGAPVQTLVAARDYELRDAANGLVIFPGWGILGGGDDYWVLADYTTTATPPPAIVTVAMRWCARLALAGGSASAVGAVVREREGDVDTQYAAPAPATAGGLEDFTADELALLAPWARPGVIA